MILFLEIIFLAGLTYISAILLYSVIKGAPFAPLGKERIKAMFELLEIKKGKKLVDLGSGDGRIVLEASRKNLQAFGYEINPILYLISKIKLKNKGKVLLKNYWKQDLSKYEYVTIYGVTYIMPALEKKLLNELSPGSKVVTNHFKFPNWKYSKKLNDVYLYTVPD